MDKAIGFLKTVKSMSPNEPIKKKYSTEEVVRKQYEHKADNKRWNKETHGCFFLEPLIAKSSKAPLYQVRWYHNWRIVGIGLYVNLSWMVLRSRLCFLSVMNIPCTPRLIVTFPQDLACPKEGNGVKVNSNYSWNSDDILRRSKVMADDSRQDQQNEIEKNSKLVYRC